VVKEKSKNLTKNIIQGEIMNRNELYHEEEVLYKKHSKEKHSIAARKLTKNKRNRRMVGKLKKHKITKIMLGRK
tara:strand:+ start:187 stop:408 length:222 start_codon:yes stop_codon:yes gene_type:complete